LRGSTHHASRSAATHAAASAAHHAGKVHAARTGRAAHAHAGWAAGAALELAVVRDRDAVLLVLVNPLMSKERQSAVERGGTGRGGAVWERRTFEKSVLSHWRRTFSLVRRGQNSSLASFFWRISWRYRLERFFLVAAGSIGAKRSSWNW
jgi:hypothetical protein